MAIANIEMIINAYITFILTFTVSGTINDATINQSTRQIERMKRSAPTISDRTFKKVIVYNDAITTLTTISWPRYAMENSFPKKHFAKIYENPILHLNLASLN